jgi:hypothetical protein
MSWISFENNKAADRFIDILITKPTIGLLSIGVFAAFIFLAV